MRAQVLVRARRAARPQASPRSPTVPRSCGCRSSAPRPPDAMQPVRDVDTIRSFLGGQGPVAIFDMPWMPIYLVFVFMPAPLARRSWRSSGVLLLIVLTPADRAHDAQAGSTDARADGGSCAQQRSPTPTPATPRCCRPWASAAARRPLPARQQRATSRCTTKASDIAGQLSGASKVLRMMLQSAMLGLGAYLTIQGEMTAGAIIAGSIASRARLAPIELAIGNWKHVHRGARQATRGCEDACERCPTPVEPLQLPAPTQHWSCREASRWRSPARSASS